MVDVGLKRETGCYLSAVGEHVVQPRLSLHNGALFRFGALAWQQERKILSLTELTDIGTLITNRCDFRNRS